MKTTTTTIAILAILLLTSVSLIQSAMYRQAQRDIQNLQQALQVSQQKSTACNGYTIE